MKVSLDKENRFLKDGKVDLKQAFIYTGIKAAWCYKKGDTTPETIRETSESTLLRMGIETYLNDHGTPDEHYQISVEITGIPKLLCMILNDEHQYSTCERSLRYTKVIENEYISKEEVEKYNKWLKICSQILEEKYMDFFLKTTPNEKEAHRALKKIAQENARQQISVMTPTSISYSTPRYQWQKIASCLLDMCANPNNPWKKMAAPYALDLVNQLVDLNVVVTTEEVLKLLDSLNVVAPSEEVLKLYNKLQEELKNDRKYLYKNNKQTKLSLFAEDNPFSGINKPNDFGASINYNTHLSISAFAQEERHRTVYNEILLPETFMYSTPDIIKGTAFEEEWAKDMKSGALTYPQGQMIKVNMITSIQKIIQFMGKERACDRAQQEIENWYVNVFLPEVIAGLKKREEYQEEAKYLEENYLNRCRCAYPDYACPNPCGHPRVRRPF